MSTAQIVDRLEALTGETDDELLIRLAQDAEAFVLAYTNRKRLPDRLVRTAGDIALIAYNRRGTEGENSRSEGGESYSFDNAPKEIFDVLDRYRLAIVGGKTYETKTDES